MKVQVKNGGMISLPAQAMAAFSIREQDILDCSLTQTGILLTPFFLAESSAGLKKNRRYRLNVSVNSAFTEMDAIIR